MNKFALLFLLLIPSLAQAQWFESSASAVVIDDDWNNARQRAIKKAVKNALVYSGGTISSLQQVSKGVLVENSLVLNSEGEIKALTIIDEQQDDENETINITLKVDIRPPEKICYGSKFLVVILKASIWA